VIRLIKQEKLSEEYSSIWIAVSLLIVVATLFLNTFLDLYSFLKGDNGSGPEIVLFFMVTFLLLFLIFISTKLSLYKKGIHVLSQELGLLRLEIEKIKKEEDD
jgi:hypothetical protein